MSLHGQHQKQYPNFDLKSYGAVVSISGLIASGWYFYQPTEERGITFVNGELSAMPGLQPDLGHVLKDGDRVAFFHLTSMWPFQYRLGSAMVDEMKNAMLASKDKGVHHTYK